MSFPDKCPNCGSKPHLPNPKEGRWFFECGAWIKDGETEIAWRNDECDNRRTIREATAIIREMMDERGNAMDSAMLEKAEEWLKDNAP